MTTRRHFIFGSFVLGCALALGVRPKPSAPTNSYPALWARADFSMDGDATSFFLFENGRLVKVSKDISGILPDILKNS